MSVYRHQHQPGSDTPAPSCQVSHMASDWPLIDVGKCVFFFQNQHLCQVLNEPLSAHLWTKTVRARLCILPSLSSPRPKEATHSLHSQPTNPALLTIFSFFLYSPLNLLFISPPPPLLLSYSPPSLHSETKQGGVKKRVIKMGMLCSEMKPVQRHTIAHHER